MLQVEDASQHSTALAVLSFFKDLNEVFLQDAAAMLTVDPERQQHPMYRLPVFDLEEWELYLQQMKECLANDEDPLEAKMESVLPGIQRWHRTNQAEMSLVSRKVDTIKESLKEEFANVLNQLEEQQEDSEWKMAKFYLDSARMLLEKAQHKKKKRRFNEEDDILLEAANQLELDATATTATATTYDDYDDNQEADPFLAAFGLPNVDAPMPMLKLPKEKNDLVLDTSVTHCGMAQRHSCLSDLWDEWHGIGKWGSDSHGGIKGRNKDYGPKWRKNGCFSQQHCSRTKRTVEAIEREAESTGVSVAEIIDNYEGAFSNGNNSVANFVAYLQQSGAVAVRKSRGKTKKTC